MTTSEQKHPSYAIVVLIIAAESVFILPFVLQRIFRSTFLEVFEVTNEKLGYCFSVYGIIALVSYLFGGPLADKFHPKNLIAAALILTALGGFYFATYPAYSQLKILYGYWGFTTIFLFWAAMIKATRIWGGSKKQGIAFGFLDGGRGLVAALFGSLGVVVFSFFLEVDISDASLIERKNAFKYVILTSSAIVSLVGISVFFLLKPLKINTHSEKRVLTISNIKKVLEYKSVWLLMIIILCAYVAYKSSDNFTLYAEDVMGYNAIKSASIGTYLLYMRPFIGVLIGLLADRTRVSFWLIIGFVLLLISSIIFATGVISEGETFLFIINIVTIAVGIYSCRVLYFATLEQAKIPVVLTGTTVGLISIIGYTPDIFSGPMFGILLDNPNKVLGLQHTFLVLSIFSALGLIATLLFHKVNTSKS